MKIPRGQNGLTQNSGGLGASTAVVILVLLFGATVYLWRARYIRRQTACVLMAVYVLAIAAIAVWTYRHPM